MVEEKWSAIDRLDHGNTSKRLGYGQTTQSFEEKRYSLEENSQ